MLTMAGGALLAIGSFLAWGSAFGISVTGIDGGDGWYTLIAGVVLAAVGYMAYTGNTSIPSWVGWVAVAVGAAVALINFFDILGEDLVDLGIGMWLCLLGAAAGLVGMLMSRNN